MQSTIKRNSRDCFVTNFFHFQYMLRFAKLEMYLGLYHKLLRRDKTQSYWFIYLLFSEIRVCLSFHQFHHQMILNYDESLDF